MVVEIEILYPWWCDEIETILSNGRDRTRVSALNAGSLHSCLHSRWKCNHDTFVSKGAGDRERNDEGRKGWEV